MEEDISVRQNKEEVEAAVIGGHEQRLDYMRAGMGQIYRVETSKCRQAVRIARSIIARVINKTVSSTQDVVPV